MTAAGWMMGSGRGVRERTAAAAVAAAARGSTLLLGLPLAGLAEALWERVPRLDHAIDDDIVERHHGRTAEILGVADYVLHSGDWSPVGEWETVIVDLDGRWGDLSADSLRCLVASGGQILLIGRDGRPIDGPGPGRFASAAHARRAFERLAAKAGEAKLADVERFLLRLQMPGGGEGKVPRGDRGTCPVTVIIPTAGFTPWLSEAIESVMQQTLPPDAVLVVSDGGGERVAEAVHPFGDRVRLLEQPRAGQAAAMNRGLAEVGTEFVACLDEDDLWLPRKLELQWRDLAAHPHAAFGVTDHYIVGERGELLEWRPLVQFDPGQVFRLLLGGSFFLGPTAMVRAEHYRSMGAEPYQAEAMRAADHAMWFSLADRGEVRVLRAALSAIRRHSGNRVTPERVRLMRETAQRTLRSVISEYPLEKFYPGLAADDGPKERPDARVEALIERAGHLLRVGLVEEAQSDVEAAIALQPESAKAWRMEAIVLTEAGERDAATNAYDRAGELGAPAGEIACGHGLLALWARDMEAASDHFRQAIATDPGLLIATYNLALMEVGLGERSEALELAKALMAGRRPRGYLLSPAPPLGGIEAELIRLRRVERGLNEE